MEVQIHARSIGVCVWGRGRMKVAVAQVGNQQLDGVRMLSKLISKYSTDR